MAKRPGLIAIPDILGRLLKTHGMESRLLECSLQEHWRTIVGAHIGSHTWPEAIRHRKLYLIAENSVWLQQLRFLKPELLAKLASHAGSDAITDIVLRVGTPPAAATPDAPAGPPAHGPADSAPDPALCEKIESSVRAVPDPELQGRLRALFEKSAKT